MSDESGFKVPPELRSPLADYFDQMMPDVLRFLDESIGTPGGPDDPLDKIIRRPTGEYDGITKLSAVIPVSDELLMDMGMLPDTRVRKPLPWRWRMRNRVSGWREKLACWAYKAIAGYEVPDGYDQ